MKKKDTSTDQEKADGGKQSSQQSSNQRTSDSSQDQGSAVESLQSSLGNQAIQRLYREGHLQAKLSVSQPGDEQEREAERVAQQVMRMSDNESPVSPESAEGVSRKGSSNEAAVDSETEQQIESVTSGGKSLPPATRSFFEPRFGRDFSDVRVHTGSDADEAARSIDAEAFTYGNDVVFRRGKYEPNSKGGKKLLGHELTHVVQQRGASPPAGSGVQDGRTLSGKQDLEPDSSTATDIQRQEEGSQSETESGGGEEKRVMVIGATDEQESKWDILDREGQVPVISYDEAETEIERAKGKASTYLVFSNTPSEIRDKILSFEFADLGPKIGPAERHVINALKAVHPMRGEYADTEPYAMDLAKARDHFNSAKKHAKQSTEPEGELGSVSEYTGVNEQITVNTRDIKGWRDFLGGSNNITWKQQLELNVFMAKSLGLDHYLISRSPSLSKEQQQKQLSNVSNPGTIDQAYLTAALFTTPEINLYQASGGMVEVESMEGDTISHSGHVLTPRFLNQNMSNAMAIIQKNPDLELNWETIKTLMYETHWQGIESVGATLEESKDQEIKTDDTDISPPMRTVGGALANLTAKSLESLEKAVQYRRDNPNLDFEDHEIWAEDMALKYQKEIKNYSKIIDAASQQIQSVEEFEKAVNETFIDTVAGLISVGTGTGSLFVEYLGTGITDLTKNILINSLNAKSDKQKEDAVRKQWESEMTDKIDKIVNKSDDDKLNNITNTVKLTLYQGMDATL